MTTRVRTVAAAIAIVAAGSLAACSQGTDATAPDNGTDTASSSSQHVNRDEAGRAATDKYGGTIKSVESDDYNGKPAWEVEIRGSDHGRIEVKVEKSTGKILHMSKD